MSEIRRVAGTLETLLIKEGKRWGRVGRKETTSADYHQLWLGVGPARSAPYRKTAGGRRVRLGGRLVEEPGVVRDKASLESLRRRNERRTAK